MSRDVRETRNEIAALQLWNGDGAARLLEADAECGALLLERLEPGTTLLDVAGTDDDSATRIAASVLRRLWRPVSDDCGLRDLASWCAGYDRNRAALSGGAKGFPSALFQRADELRQELLASTPGQMAFHGDLHHYNVLWRDSEWVVIDPKGLAGDPAFDVCQFLRNPRMPVPLDVNRRRLDIFCDELGLDRGRTRDWAFVHAVLDACWDFEDGNDFRASIAYAEQTLRY